MPKTREKLFFKRDLLVLSLLSKRDYYGYEMVKIIKNITNNQFEISSGSLYPILNRLASDGYISFYEEIEHHKLKCHYHIEQKGIDYYNELLEEYHQNIQYMNSILDYSEKV